jgi:hypothetical protein
MKPLSNNTVGQEMEQPPVAVNGGIPVTTGTCAGRQHLPTRRSHEAETTEHGGQKYHVGVGRDHAGVVREVFITVVDKPGSMIAELVETTAVLISLLLQHNVSLSTIKHSITGPAAAALALDLFTENSCSSPGAHGEQEQGHHAHHDLA